MKRVNVIWALIPFIMAGCGQRQEGNDDFITVDVTKTDYPKKELILQDFMDVEYLALETKDDFLCQGFVQDIGEKIILVTNRQINDGDIFVYNRNGKALRKINRKGQGGEEYTYITNIILDEDKDEMYVHDHQIKKIQVYNLSGVFKRSLPYKENTNGMLYTDIDNYDRNNLICFDEYSKGRAFVLMSKRDGRITQKIGIPVKETKFLIKFSIDEANNRMLSMGPDPYPTIIPFNGNKILLELSSDTIYTFSPDYSLHPFIVRTPSVQSMEPEVMLILRLLSERYYFMETIRNEYDFDTKKGFSKTYFMYDKQEKSFGRYIVYNGDYIIQKEIYMSLLRPVDYENESWQSLDASKLVESYANGELKDGKLKEIAATLDEESNPVIMLIKHKK
ncbi:6-bladed beta-propeller [Parabacteroides sp. Marseille-P3160]|uniref:6-bladed beta-propeller n=1 Tax=Parabacteroides sp. Marseille-P3160 TaxID=1917887 RepID=UPI0009B952E5|nr:6-bladed beta-propeller [Parabacteroides sp. Marseille-P3160]